MRKYITTIFIIIWYTTFAGYAQGNSGFYLSDPIPSLSEESAFLLLRENPAFVHCMAEDSSFKSYEFGLNQFYGKKNRVRSSFYMTDTNGDYLFYQGNKVAYGGIEAAGEKSYKRLGTLYGSASYMRESNRSVLLNYAIHPENYYPYLVSDTMGLGKMSKEIYRVAGGFGFCHRKVYWGVYGEYEGTVASKLTDPKLSVYDSWFRLRLGMSTLFGTHLFAAYLAPEMNKQNISSGSYKHAAVKYFQFYGFGEWSRKESKAGYDYGRMMGIKGMKANVIVKKKLNQPTDFNYLASFSYHFQRMATEEDSYKNLFIAPTHQIAGFFMCSKKHKHWTSCLIYAGGYSVRNGTENIYENKEVSEDQNLYDYTKVGENKLYKLSESYSKVLLKAICYFRSKHEMHYAIGGQYASYRETYLSPSKEVENQTFSPLVSIACKVNHKNQRLELYTQWEYKFPLLNKFDNPMPLQDNLTIVQQSYIPYLIRGESAHFFTVKAHYGYSLKNRHIIGGNLQFLHQLRTNVKDNYQMGSQYRKQYIFACSLFYLF